MNTPSTDAEQHDNPDSIVPLAGADVSQDELVAYIRYLGETRFAARAAQYDLDATFPTENYKDLHAAGFLALMIAGLNARYDRWVLGVLGFVLGIATMGGPWVLGYADQIMVALNTSITGVVIVSIAVAEIVSGRNRHGPS